MIYDVAHLTRYQYGAPVVANDCVLRLRPRDEPGQRISNYHVEVRPMPREFVEREDAFGNHAARLRIETRHTQMSIKSSFRAEVARAAPPIATLTPPWETAAALAAASPSIAADSPAFGLYPSRLASLFADATCYARHSFAPARPVYEAAAELSRRIKADFAYDSEATEVTTAPAAAFAARRGVCQDFAHVMIAGLRGLGLPALYVSGYIRTLPAPGKQRLVGADASHAWVALWCGPSFGWLGLDPTNAIAEGDDHIVVARGRDYVDVPPVDGVILSYGGHELEVSVDVAPVEGKL
ncbi:MAG TPA: transglutaminase family protein [Roseiarcus sp.]|nr:transglutaminase family protein [Roseiarcus sp.]